MATRYKRHSANRPTVSVAAGRLIPRSKSGRKAAFPALFTLASVAAASARKRGKR